MTTRQISLFYSRAFCPTPFIPFGKNKNHSFNVTAWKVLYVDRMRRSDNNDKELGPGFVAQLPDWSFAPLSLIPEYQNVDKYFTRAEC